MADNETTDKNRNKIKPIPYKFNTWFTGPLNAFSEKNRITTTEILVRAACKYMKTKIPKDYKFRGKNKAK